MTNPDKDFVRAWLATHEGGHAPFEMGVDGRHVHCLITLDQDYLMAYLLVLDQQDFLYVYVEHGGPWPDHGIETNLVAGLPPLRSYQIEVNSSSFIAWAFSKMRRNGEMGSGHCA